MLDMLEEFRAWLAEDFVYLLERGLKVVAVLVGAVFLLPFWLLPFLWWFFRERRH